MTPEEKQLLVRTAELTEENNKILRGIRRSGRIANAFRILYWALIIGSAVGAYYFIQPYIDAITAGYSGMKDNLNTVKNVTTNLPSWLTGNQ